MRDDISVSKVIQPWVVPFQTSVRPGSLPEAAAAGNRFSEAWRGSQGPNSSWASRPRAPLVGRDADIARIQREWQEVFDGKGRVVLLSGKPRIGKARLA